LALYLACRHPERFLGVVSVDPLGAVVEQEEWSSGAGDPSS
jgi:pimeloyl-ACP methyl ester carboxylesterase